MRVHASFKMTTLSTGLLLAFAPLAQPVFANPALSSVEVQAQREALSAASVQVAREKLNQTAGGTAVVEAESFEAGKAVTIKDMLDFTPGVFAQSRVNEEARLSIRGSGLSRTFHMRGIRLLQDGIPINLADGGSDFQDIDPLALQHVEVYKGANALQYGAANLGGAINFVTPTGYTTPNSVLRLDAGSHEFARAQFKTGDVLGNWDYFASLSQLRSDGFRQFSGQKNTRLNANAGLKISPQLETRFYVIHGDLNQELPGNLTKAQLQSNPTQANAASAAANSQRDFLITRLANKTTWISPTGVEYNAGVYAVDKNLYHPLSFGLIDQQTRDVGTFGNRIAQGELWGLRHDTTLGYNLVHGITEARIFNHVRGDRISLRSHEDQKAHNMELYGESRLHLTDSVQWINGLQWTHAKRTADDQFLSDGDGSYQRRYAQFSPKTGLLWQASKAVQVYGNLSRAFEPPTFSETSPTRALEAQESTTFEVGTRGMAQEIRWDISAYYSQLNNEFVSYQLNPLVPGLSAILNADNTVHQGVEIGLAGPFTRDLLRGGDTLNWQLAYTFGRFRFDNDRIYGNAAIPGIPEQYVRAKLDYANTLGWTLSPNIEYVPQGYFVDLANTLSSDPYLLLGLNASYKFSDTLRVFVDARNLTDKVYAATTGVIVNANGADSAQFSPGEGRSIYAGVEVKW
ncbi:MAG: TonB-dependent receptor [Betaproteobacteria bacterium]|jgi:iron complex outermembrane receptor protein|nr:MAG: TonB-dependent receptor [Betaproteobacteria bacterium]PZO26046.1 MAG: TonB-dependent receptor [Betaproteobacteria bacterium]PZO30672.1 MAG: TonB-dependent receptor [Betaproteobacteria bacterium]